MVYVKMKFICCVLLRYPNMAMLGLEPNTTMPLYPSSPHRTTLHACMSWHTHCTTTCYTHEVIIVAHPSLGGAAVAATTTTTNNDHQAHAVLCYWVLHAALCNVLSPGMHMINNRHQQRQQQDSPVAALILRKETIPSRRKSWFDHLVVPLC